MNIHIFVLRAKFSLPDILHFANRSVSFRKLVFIFKSAVFWDITPVEGYQRFGEKYCPHLQVQNVSQAIISQQEASVASCLDNTVTPIMAAVRSETSVNSTGIHVAFQKTLLFIVIGVTT
jgi:hypothetical protein